MSQVEDLRNGLRNVVRDLREARNRLLELQRTVPRREPSEEELDEEPDPLSEMGAAIECGLHDCLEPLIRDLTAAAESPEESI
jgi:hypothetical protein